MQLAKKPLKIPHSPYVTVIYNFISRDDLIETVITLI